MQKQIKVLLTILTVLILAVSCAKNNPNNPNNPNTSSGKRGEYKLLTDESILALPWSDPVKQKYFKDNWMNTFTNQTLLSAGVTGTTRKTDENGTYMENDCTVLGKFIHATNVEWKGTNWIGALYLDERNSDSSKWIIFHIDTEGNLMNASGYGINKDGAMPTDEQWKTSVYEKWGAYPIGTIQNFDYKK